MDFVSVRRKFISLLLALLRSLEWPIPENRVQSKVEISPLILSKDWGQGQVTSYNRAAKAMNKINGTKIKPRDGKDH